MKKLLLALFISLFSINTSAQNLESYSQQKFLGLDTTTSPAIIDPSQASQMSNFEMDKFGAITQRDLFAQYNTVAGALGTNNITGIFKLYTGTNTRYFVACGGNKIAKGSAGAWTNITNSDITPTSGTYWDAVIFDSELWLVNESVKLQAWNGASSSTATPADYPATNCRYIELHKYRLWAACSDSHPNRVYFSSLNRGFDWTTTGGYIDIATDDGDKIVGLVSMGGYLYVVKQNTIYLIYGDSPNEFGVRKTFSAVGAIAPRSIAKVERGIFFLGRNNVYFFNGSISESISAKIQATINSWEEVQKVNACAIFDNKNHYRLSVAEEDSTINNAEYIYDTTLKEWYRNGEEYFSYYCLAEGGGDKGEIYGGSSQNNGIVWQLTGETGVESYIHKTQTDLKTGVTFNVVHDGTESSPIVTLKGGEYSADTYTKLLLHFNDNVTDSSENAHTINNTNVIFSDTVKELGTHSAFFEGSSAYLASADSDDWYFGTGDFTIDFWVRFDSLTNGVAFSSQFEGTDDYWWLFKDLNVNGNKLLMQFKKGGAEKGYYAMTTAWSPTVDTWYHLAFVRNGATGLIFIDGISQTLTEHTAFASNDVGNIPRTLQICRINEEPYRLLDGYLDEFRISKGIARWTTNFTPGEKVLSGTLTSTNLKINASGQEDLGDIYWQETLQSNTDIQMTVRVGATNDLVYYNGWENWVSTSTSFYWASDSSAWTSSSVHINVSAPTIWTDKQRDVIYYETDDNASPDCVRFVVQGTNANEDYVYATIPVINISDYKWLGYWIMSPVTGNSVRLGFGETEGNEFTTTVNTVEANVWEYHYCPLDSYTDADIDAIGHLQLHYVGSNIGGSANTCLSVVTGNVLLGNIYAYDFLDSSEEMSVTTPNDWIQYRAILGTTDGSYSPQLENIDNYVITLEYASLGTQESSMTSDYYTHWLDLKSPQVNKTFYDLFTLIYGETDSTVKINYDIDYGTTTGTFWYNFEGENTTNRLHNWFDAGNYGKRIRFHIQATSTTAKNSIRQKETRFRKMPWSPD